MRFTLPFSRTLNRTRMSRLLLSLGLYITTLGGCGQQAVSRSLEELSLGSLWVTLDYAPDRVQVYLYREKGFYDCPVLTGHISATINGNPSIGGSLGGVIRKEEYETYCSGPYFEFPREPLKVTAGAPDGNFVLSDGSYTMRLSVKNLLAERKLLRLTAAADLKPGSQIKFTWQPATDSLLEGSYSISGGSYFHHATARVETGMLIAELPTEPWPKGAELHSSGVGLVPIVKCEGVQTCDQIQILRSEHIELPSL